MDDINKIKPLPINGQPSGLDNNMKKKNSNSKKIIFRIFAVFIAIGMGLTGGTIIWFINQLSPIDKESKHLIQFTIKTGENAYQIGKNLENASIIKSSIAFNTYVKYTKNNSKLQAGFYRLSPAESTQQIVSHLIKGSVDQFSITFYPGSTITDNYTKDESKKYDVTTVLKRSGYSDDEISLALAKTYDSPLFKDKPIGTDLEGYVYGETYQFNVGASVEDILQATFDEFYADIEENDLVKLFADKGLNLYEGITLASIIQREAGNANDQKQVSQVFHSRLAIGMSLGSDVTYQYICDKMGTPRDSARCLAVDSPYNTRIYTGFTPGPISAPGLSALKATAEPAEGDYLFFLAGDDGVIYYANTQAEHERNIVDHCQIGCSIQ